MDTKFRDASHVGKPLSKMAAKTHGNIAYKNFLKEVGVKGFEDAVLENRSAASEEQFSLPDNQLEAPRQAV